MNAIIKFQSELFIDALKNLFKELNVPMNYIADEPTTAKEILKDTYKDNSTFKLIDEVFLVGMVDDAAFEGNESLSADKIKSDYDGIIVFGITLHQRENNLLPTRSQLAEISRAFNREFYYTPVVLVFKYNDDNSKYIAFANTERLKYKQEWREGEKAGKVSLLRDVDIQNLHRGHEDIINQLRIPTTGIKLIDSFDKLYTFWQEIFSVNILNKKFYQELSNWYFWAVKQVTFPSKPTEIEAHNKNAKLEDLIQEHNATNVIRLLTRLLFTWFIKEKKLIPEQLFDLEKLQKDILNEIEPYHENGLFIQANKESVYYKAILQNLFFASLNCPIKPDSLDKRSRRFRLNNYYGQDRGNDWLYKYENHFKNPDGFLELINKTVPFLNGGLFECLDDKTKNLYVDGFSDNMSEGELLIVPDYLFFGVEEHIDLSTEYGVSNSGTKNAAVKGLINILKSYKFTITENTPIEEDVALDPELLGQVFENLLASYNPETKTTARKQTGSFYTPREIVNYMVDESLIAYLKNAIFDWGTEEELDEKLHQLASFDSKNPFEGKNKLIREIIFAIDRCKILDPACGSGAFPMGTLQKMVHILQKLDPNNDVWKEIQKQKVLAEATEVFNTIEDKIEREEKLKEINNAFDQRVNDPDYARKLYLIENCIYGVDIQPIATQIAKLRFFISLVVDQKKNENEVNFGIRPLPNLETKFVTANTLIGIEKPNAQQSLYDSDEIKALETELKKVRHKLFGARTKDTKLKHRQKDKELRSLIALELEKSGWKGDTAQKLASWDPYDQNASSSFFNSEWMFDISQGFDIVIGNPPYLIIPKDEFIKNYKGYIFQEGKPDLYRMFIERANSFLANKSAFCFITPNTFLTIPSAKKLRLNILTEFEVKLLLNFDETVFESASVNSLVFLFFKGGVKDQTMVKVINKTNELYSNHYQTINSDEWIKNEKHEFNIFIDSKNSEILSKIQGNCHTIGEYGFNVSLGAQQYHNTIHNENQIKSKFLHSSHKLSSSYTIELGGKNIDLFNVRIPNNPTYVDLSAEFYTKPDFAYFSYPRIIFREIPGKTIISAYTEDTFVINKSCYSIIGDSSKLKNLQLVLSSSLMAFYIFNSGDKSNQRLFPRITKGAINKLPIKLFPNNQNAIIIHDILQNKAGSLEFIFFQKLQDALVFELYFPNHMKEREIDVLQFIEKDVAEIMHGNDFSSLENNEKEYVTELLQTKWTHPDSEVRNRIKLFAVRSPEILKPILES